MKRWVIVLVSCVVLLAAGAAVVTVFVRSTRSWVRTLSWPDPDLRTVADGVYEGSASLRLVPGTAAANREATVRVTVENHRYTEIEVVRPQQIAPQMTRFAQTVLDRQSLRLDGISGATVTKAAVLMAASRALTVP